MPSAIPSRKKPRCRSGATHIATIISSTPASNSTGHRIRKRLPTLDNSSTHCASRPSPNLATTLLSCLGTRSAIAGFACCSVSCTSSCRSGSVSTTRRAPSESKASCARLADISTSTPNGRACTMLRALARISGRKAIRSGRLRIAVSVTSVAAYSATRGSERLLCARCANRSALKRFRSATYSSAPATMHAVPSTTQQKNNQLLRYRDCVSGIAPSVATPSRDDAAGQPASRTHSMPMQPAALHLH